MNASTAAGLSDNLESLAKLVDDEEEEEGLFTRKLLVQMLSYIDRYIDVPDSGSLSIYLF